MASPKPRAVAHLPGISAPPGSVPLRTSGRLRRRLAGWRISQPRRGSHDGTPPISYPATASNFRFCTTPNIRCNLNSRDAQNRREATERPKSPCTPEIGPHQWPPQGDSVWLHPTPEGQRDSVNCRVRTIPLHAGPPSPPSGTGRTLQAGDTRPKARVVSLSLSLSHRAYFNKHKPFSSRSHFETLW